MQTINSIFHTFKPGIPKRYLLLVAGCVWTIAGGMLLFRGFLMLKFNSERIDIEEFGSICAGIVFYKYMFSRISAKHINRILSLQTDKPCFFSFFNWRSYLMMVLMITCGIGLRMSGIIPAVYLSLFYIAMGTPLFISAIRFYSYEINYNKVKNRFDDLNK